MDFILCLSTGTDPVPEVRCFIAFLLSFKHQTMEKAMKLIILNVIHNCQNILDLQCSDTQATRQLCLAG